MSDSVSNLVYFLDGKAYINITNACTNSCLFCVRDIKDNVKGANLWLSEKVTADDVIAQIEKYKEKIKGSIVFCGYGEPLVRYKEVVKIARYIKKNLKDIKIRINTNGHGNFIHKKNIVPDLKECIDSISISLNAQDESLYNELSKPSFEGAYQAMLDFTKECTKAGIDTTMSVVSNYKEYGQKLDVNACEKIAQNLGAKFRVREWIEEGY